MSLSSPIQVGDNIAVRWCKAQRALRRACDNFGISYTMSGFLQDINLGDNIAVRWAKFGAWLDLLATGSGGGGTGNVRSGTVALAQDDVSAAVTFSPAFSGVPDTIVPTIAAPDGTTGIEATVDYSTLTANGVTVRFPGIPAANFKLLWIANKS